MLNEPEQERINQRIRHHTQSPERVNTREPHIVRTFPGPEANRLDQYTTRQYNNYPNPYISNQILADGESMNRPSHNYAGVKDTSSTTPDHVYNTQPQEHVYTSGANSRPVQDDLPPSYEETTAYPALYKVKK